MIIRRHKFLKFLKIFDLLHVHVTNVVFLLFFSVATD